MKMCLMHEKYQKDTMRAKSTTMEQCVGFQLLVVCNVTKVLRERRAAVRYLYLSTIIPPSISTR